MTSFPSSLGKTTSAVYRAKIRSASSIIKSFQVAPVPKTQHLRNYLRVRSSPAVLLQGESFKVLPSWTDDHNSTPIVSSTSFSMSDNNHVPRGGVTNYETMSTFQSVLQNPKDHSLLVRLLSALFVILGLDILLDHAVVLLDKLVTCFPAVEEWVFVQVLLEKATANLSIHSFPSEGKEVNSRPTGASSSPSRSRSGRTQSRRRMSRSGLSGQSLGYISADSRDTHFTYAREEHSLSLSSATTILSTDETEDYGYFADFDEPPSPGRRGSDEDASVMDGAFNFHGQSPSRRSSLSRNLSTLDSLVEERGGDSED